jgi:hypothetical protein
MLEAPSYTHIPYRPGESLGCLTVVAGRIEWQGEGDY